MPVEVWRAPRSSVVGLDPGVVGDRPVPHLLAALLTPTHAPHARLPKHWKGELSRQRWSDTRFLVASLALCFFLSPFAFPLLTLFSSEHFFPLHSLLTFSPRTFSLKTFSPQTFSLQTFSLENVPLARFYIPWPSPRGAVHPKLTPPHWGKVTMTTRALSKKADVGAHERLPLRKNGGGLQSS